MNLLNSLKSWILLRFRIRFGNPSAATLASVSTQIFLTPEAACASLGLGNPVFEPSTTNAVVNFPEVWNSGDGFRSFVAAAIRTEKPLRVVETGIANGWLTRTVLRELDENGGGELISFDISEKSLLSVKDIPPTVKWMPIILQSRGKKARRREFERTVADFSDIGVWIHDGDHSYRWQTWEYAAALRCLTRGGLLISDDIDSSYAWVKLLQQRGLTGSVTTFESHKFWGAVRVNSR